MSITSKKESFVARFAKESSRTSSKLQPGSENFTKGASQSPSDQKPIDLQKKMQAELIYLVKGIDAERNAWYYVLVERNKVSIFLRALNDEIIHLEKFGKILFSAYGEEPPSEITNKLKEEYGIK